LVDIAAGDEITISYLGSEQCSRRDERQAKLRDDFGFTCGCAKCTNITPEAVRLSDARRSSRSGCVRGGGQRKVGMAT
jgi:hypothetical protein